MPVENAIEAKGLVKRYGDKLALDGVDIEVARGSVCGLLGPNGAGKTTAVRLLTTLTTPDAGTAFVAGHDVLRDPSAVRRSIGLAAQDATLDGLLTGRENLVMIGELHHIGRRAAKLRATELLERFGLADAGDKVSKEYSGGMRRRLDLAATLVSEPEVLFLDEPTTGLDPRGRNELWDVLDGLVAGGVTILLTTQYLEEADRLADDIFVVDHGRVIARGDARSLKRQVGGDQLHVVCANVADLETVAELVERVSGATATIDKPARSVTAPTDGGAAALATLGGELVERAIAVDDLGLSQPTLEDVFLTLTGAPLEADDEEKAGGKRGKKKAARVSDAKPTHNTFLGDTWVIARRGLLHMRRQPEMLADATIQPIMFVLLFAFVFGGAIHVPGGGSYRSFLMGGIFAQTIAFGSFGVAIALAHDRTNGAIDRFHALPIRRSSVLAGHAVANLLKALVPITLMSLAGLAVGWRVQGGVLDAIAAYGVMIVFSFAVIWVGVLLGSVVATPEGVQGIAFVAIFPITFVASTFVPVTTLPTGLRQFAEWNPVTALAGALRNLFANPGGVTPTHGPWSLMHPVLYTLLWGAGIVALCAPLAISRYQASIAG